MGESFRSLSPAAKLEASSTFPEDTRGRTRLNRHVRDLFERIE